MAKKKAKVGKLKLKLTLKHTKKQQAENRKNLLKELRGVDPKKTKTFSGGKEIKKNKKRKK